MMMWVRVLDCEQNVHSAGYWLGTYRGGVARPDERGRSWAFDGE